MTKETIEQILQGLGVVGAVIASIIGVWVAREKSRGAAELKRIDASAEWQQQMLERIKHVEGDARRERERGDQLEKEAYDARREAADRKWEMKRLQADYEILADRYASARSRNEAMAQELQEVHRQLRASSSTRLSLPPPSVRLRTISSGFPAVTGRRPPKKKETP